MDIQKTKISDGDKVIIEKLADYAHEAWSGWMRYLFSLSRLHCEGVFIPERWIERWMRQMSTPYQGLSESEKESDRAEARKMLAIIRGEEQWRALSALVCRGCGGDGLTAQDNPVRCTVCGGSGVEVKL